MAASIATALPSVSARKKTQPDHHHQYRIRVAQWSRQHADATGQPDAFEHEEDAVIQTPHDERPAGAMPEATQEEHEHEVEVHAGRVDVRLPPSGMYT